MRIWINIRFMITSLFCLSIMNNTIAETTSSALDSKKPTSINGNLPNANLRASSARKAERMYYLEAKKALDKNQFARYQELLPNIKNYPLLPYLEYQELGERLMALPKKEVEQFFSRYPNSYVAERLRHRWLRTLALKAMWSDYLKFYDPNLTDPELGCLSVRARLSLGDKTALKDIEPIWNVGKVQSKSCDPVFAEWKQEGYLTPGLLWSRHSKAVKADEMTLAASLAQEMTENQKNNALTYGKVAQNPRLILQNDQFNTQTAEGRAIIAIGIERLSQTDVQLAYNAWQTYLLENPFTETEIANVNYIIARQFIRQDNPEAAELIASATPNLNNSDLIEALIRESLRRQDWLKSMQWISRLPAEVKTTERWSYWQARLMEQLNIREAQGKKPQDIYAKIANTRGFYGFLASDRLGLDYSLQDKPLSISKETLRSIEAEPGIQRAREFYLLGEFGSASREWTYTTHHFPTTEQMVAAGHIADQWGWHREAIQTMQDADYMDDLAIRFPTPFQENIKTAARSAALDPHFIYAITKQESAFNIEAKSPVGATGLMQLMPTTAKVLAKKVGLKFQQKDLLNADTNIVLGSRYLGDLMTTFSGNRILAAAAYNAGPSRVKQWMSKDEKKLPYDIWIETIPYKETRFYVQNILSFSVIYAYRSGNKQPFISEQEAQATL